MTTKIDVSGAVSPGYEAVRDAFAHNFTDGEDVGASLAIYRDGVPVVDLWAGLADVGADRQWASDTVTLVYSATKGATSVLMHRLFELGIIDPDAAVADYWPEFSANGKSSITVRQLLSHQAGLPVPDAPLTRDQLFEGRPAWEALAAQAPLWTPGTAHGYHALTFGWLVSGLVANATGSTVSDLFKEHIAGPLDLAFWIGLPDDVEVDLAPLLDGTPDPSVIDQIQDPDAKSAVLEILSALGDPDSLFSRVLSTNGALPTPHAETWNVREALRGEQPAANGVTNARSLAKMYAATVSEVDGIRILSAQTVESARSEQVHGPDVVLMGPTRFGTGFSLPDSVMPMLGPSSFGHQGAGGALGFADVEHRIGFGYAQNQLSSSLVGELRTPIILDALRGSL